MHGTTKTSPLAARASTTRRTPGRGSLYLASLAGFFKKKYGDLDPTTRGQRIYDDLVKETIKGIGIHEIGHSLGLRHNFASSWDAPNYNPQYWQLRTNEGQGEPADARRRAPATPTRAWVRATSTR